MLRFFSLGIILLCSCNKELVKQPDLTTQIDVQYSIISIIHADADYLYHEAGTARKADEEALQKSIKMAEKAQNGEVFIFHQKPEKKAWFIFPKKDREWYHYKNGVLINKGKYSPMDGGFQQESNLYTQHSAYKEGDRKPILMYFGHEIPTFQRNYHHSQTENEFNSSIFSESLKKFSNNFELIGLSTCNNGNPLLMNSLLNKAEVVVASPQNLHLSYLEVSAFSVLETKPTIKGKALADSVAHSSFMRLSNQLQTTVTVSIYSLQELRAELPYFAEVYQNYIQQNEANNYFSDNIDCAAIEKLTQYVPVNGVKTYYKAPAFGRSASKNNHSGWGCKDLN